MNLSKKIIQFTEKTNSQYAETANRPNDNNISAWIFLLQCTVYYCVR